MAGYCHRLGIKETAEAVGKKEGFERVILGSRPAVLSRQGKEKHSNDRDHKTVMGNAVFTPFVKAQAQEILVLVICSLNSAFKTK